MSVEFKSKSPIEVEIGDLPPELFDSIFVKLSQRDIQTMACVNQVMKNNIIEIVNINKNASIKNLIKIITNNLNSIQQEPFLEISENITSQYFPNLLIIKKSIFDVKEQLINVMTRLDTNQTIDEMQEEAAQAQKAVQLSVPKFMENIFNLSHVFPLSIIYRKIKLASTISDDRERGLTLSDISQ